MPLLIDPASVDVVKRSADLPALARAHGVELKRKGRQLVGRCPFHSPDKTPSFFIDSARGLWKCFGACTAKGADESGGDAIKFEMKVSGLTFREAFEKLGGRIERKPTPPPKKKLAPPAGGGVPKQTPSGRGGMDLLSRVVAHYRRRFLEAPEGARYLASRGITDEGLLGSFHVGYADGTLLSKIPAVGELRDGLASLGVISDKGSELLRGCVVFPLSGSTGEPVSLYGRAVERDSHLFLPGPRRGLFGVNGAKSIPELVVTESIIDALSFLQAGVPHVLPLYGVNGFTDDHAAWIEEARPERVLIALDTDDTGRKGAAVLADRLTTPGRDVVIVDLPTKDANELLTREGSAGFAETWRSLTGASARPRAYAPSRVTRESAQAPESAGAGALAPAPAPTSAHERASADAPALVREAAPLSPPEPERAKEETSIVAGVSTVTHEGDELRFSSGLRVYEIKGTFEKPERSGTVLRVRVKLTAGDSKIIETVDLYSPRSRNAFLARALASRMGERADIERDFVLLVEHIETIQKAHTPEPPKPLEMPATERAAAERTLKARDLLAVIVKDLTTLGYVGEETNKQLGYLVAVSRKLDAPLSAVIMSQSGSGKSGLAEVLEQLTPPEDLVLFSRITSQALYYMDRDALRHRFVIIEERAGSEEADYSIRALQSKRKLVLAASIKDPSTGRIKTQTFEILGPSAFLETTTESAINHENATRCFEMYLDESEEQTRRIHEMQRFMKTPAGRAHAAERAAVVRRHHNMQRLLLPAAVEIPFADLIEFPAAWLRTRRDNARFLNLIEATAFLYQHQRETRVEPGGSRVVEASIEDYAHAYQLAGELLGYTLADLKKPAAELLAEIRVMAAERADGRSINEVSFTRRDVREATGLPNHRIKQLFADLEELEYVTAKKGPRGASAEYHLAAERLNGTQIQTHLLTPDQLAKKWKGAR